MGQVIKVNARLDVELGYGSFVLRVEGWDELKLEYGDTFALESALAKVKESDQCQEDMTRRSHHAK
jgi:hypothetical protein